MSRHSTGHRVNRITNFSAVVFQNIAKLPDRVLGLGHRHAVARHKHHRAGGLEDKVSIIRRDGMRFSLNLLAVAGCAHRRLQPAK